MSDFATEIDTRSLDRLIDRLRRQSPRLLRELVRDEAGNAALAIARALPPRKVGQGRRKVAADIRRVFITANVAYREMRSRNPDIAKAFWKAYKAGDDTTARELLRQSGVRYDTAVFLDQPSSAMHRAARTRSGGVPKNEAPRAIIRDAGSLRDYLRGRQMNVGYLKSPWARVAVALGKRAPAWMTQPDGPHILEDNTQSLLTPSITIGSRVKHADDRRFLGAINHALRGRERALTARAEKEYDRLARGSFFGIRR